MVMLEGASIGWVAALCAIVAHGSFGVPIKSETCRRLDIDPLVFQTYKTIMCLVFSFTAVWAMGIPMTFSPWGIISGLFWVPGGVATVMAVKLLGLSLAVAVGNSLIALVTFTWGIFIFHEKVHSKPMACLAVSMMIAGFVGMSFFSSQEKQSNDESSSSSTLKSLQEPLLKLVDTKQAKVAVVKKLDDESSLDGTLSDTDSEETDSCNSSISSSTKGTASASHRRSDSSSSGSSKAKIRNRKAAPQSQLSSSFLDLPSVDELALQCSNEDVPATFGRESFIQVSKSSVIICGTKVSRFQAGLAVATMGGLWGGSVMIPMKLCQEDTSGLGYLVSFSSGATLVTMTIWFFRFLYHVSYSHSIKSAYQALPSFHLREMWFHGGLSGLLWSTGNLFSILSVYHLGAGVGYCVVQSSMLGKVDTSTV